MVISDVAGSGNPAGDWRRESCFEPHEKGFVPLLSCQMSVDKCIRIHGLSDSGTPAEIRFGTVKQTMLVDLRK
jgi:hypothetical protein